MRTAVFVGLAAVAALHAAAVPFADTAVQPLLGLDEITAALRSQDEVSAFFVVDSADSNSHRVVQEWSAAAANLAGFARFYAVDIRDPDAAWLMDAWNVQMVPAVRGLSPDRVARAAWQGRPLGTVGGSRPVSELPLDRGFSEAALKKFVLSLQGAAPITSIDTDAKAKALHGAVTAGTQPRPSVVLLSPKTTSSQLFKAVAISFKGRCDFYDVHTSKAKGALALFGAAKLPTLLLFARDGSFKTFSGSLTPTAIAAFVDQAVEPREEFAKRLAAADGSVLEREVARQAQGALRITGQSEWEADVAHASSITCVFVTDGDAAPAGLGDAVRELRAQGQRFSVGTVSWLKRADAPRTAAFLVDVDGGETAAAGCVSAKKGVLTRFFGTPSAATLADFFNGPLSRGVGAKQFESLPGFE